MADDTSTYVPARYVGEHSVRLAPRRGGYKHGDGSPRVGDDALLLKPGETLLVPATELHGETLLVDPSGLASDVRSLGIGFAPLPQHATMTRDELIGARFLVDGRLRAYEFHDGRDDFEPVDAAAGQNETEEDAPAESSDASSTAKRAHSKNAAARADATSERADDAAQGA